MHSYLINFIIFLFIHFLPLFLAKKEIAFLQCIWRHGDRGPSKLPYPGDPYDESFWPRGWNQLTNLGMQQMNELGQFLRQRYVEDWPFLSSSYDPDEVFVQSSDSKRALVSAQALLHGLYPVIDPDDQFDPNLNWLPIAVHSTGANNELLKPTSFECPTYEGIKKTTKKELENELKIKYKDLFEFVQINVFNSTMPLTLHQVASLNNLNREIAHNLTQPAWVERRWPQYGNWSTLELVTELRRLERINEFNRPEMAYLMGGYLLGDWINRAEKVINSKSPNEAEKAVLYSSHDGTLQALLSLMGQRVDKLVPYASTICMEILKNNDTYHIEMYYRHSGLVQHLNFPDCPLIQCPAETLIKSLRSRAIFERKRLYHLCGSGDAYC